MKLYVKVAASAIGVLLLSMPVAVLVTIFLMPLWSWIEQPTGSSPSGIPDPRIGALKWSSRSSADYSNWPAGCSTGGAG